jgi:hypothetical protein
MQTNPEHITFRPGELLERLTRGPLSAGATAKRDVGRYYALLDDAWAHWRHYTLMDGSGWPPVVAFIATREWVAVPGPKQFFEQFRSFLRSPMAEEFNRIDLSAAATAVSLATAVEVAAIIDRAEVDFRSQASATVGATSAAG